MSLATTTAASGGLGGGGLSATVMAHNTAPALQHQHHQHTHQSIPGAGGGPSGLPVTNVALGADLLDKNQKCLTGKGVRGAAKMPIVAMDLWGDGAVVGYFPPIDKDEDGKYNLD
ncbi:hypothetical protein HJC23_013791 [Cyclotella cryptica]|uniref:Uncharacterized protein n=1 Tax=Cyclotella cryptica TaxID=29204 RepID=A0ABD3PKF7_9STRA